MSITDTATMPTRLEGELRASDGLRGDTLRASVLLMLSMTVVQRLLGFARGVLFCRWLDAEQLGQWDVAFGFLMLAAPVAVLGLPGSFGRYLEYYRQRGMLRDFVWRTSRMTACLGLAGCALVALANGWFSELVFGTSDDGSLVVLLAACLAMVIVYNFLCALFTALKLIRVASWLQFGNAVAFAFLGALLLVGWRASAMSVVLAFCGACVLSNAAGLWWLRRSLAAFPSTVHSAPSVGLWGKLLPFAIWVWIGNWLANLFEMADRYLIIHFSGADAATALSMVGEYHSSRVVPYLFLGIAELLASMVMPHLSQDWEARRRDEVGRRLNLMLKLFAVALTVGSVVVLFGRHLLFDVAFGGKYSDGLELLPWALTYCSWCALGVVAMTYLWCAEKARLASLSLLAGLLLNVALGSLLLPAFGLTGAVLARASANLLALATLYLLIWWHGMKLDIGTLILSMLPALFTLGPWVTLTALVLIGLRGLFSDGVFAASEKETLLGVWNHYWERLRPCRDVSG